MPIDSSIIDIVCFLALSSIPQNTLIPLRSEVYVIITRISDFVNPIYPIPQIKRFQYHYHFHIGSSSEIIPSAAILPSTGRMEE